MEYPKDKIEFQGAWNQCAGKVSALNGVIAKIEDRAAKNFIAGRDDAAEELRSLCKDVKRLYTDLSSDLQGFITESQKRDWEIRKAQGRA